MWRDRRWQCKNTYFEREEICYIIQLYNNRYANILCSYSLLSLAINDDENMFRCKYPKICFIYMDTKTWHSDLILELQWNRILMREIELVIYVIQKWIFGYAGGQKNGVVFGLDTCSFLKNAQMQIDLFALCSVKVLNKNEHQHK